MARARVAHLARIDHRHWQRRGRQRGNERDLAPAGGLHHDQLGLQRLQLRGQVGDTRLVMGAHPLLPTGPHGNVQLGFGDVDPDVREVHIVFLPLLPHNRPALSHAGSLAGSTCSGSSALEMWRP
jgi:hypothetical protein